VSAGTKPQRLPTREELRQAFQAGFQSIDAGDTFYAGFEAFLTSIGYRKREEAGCTCRDDGAARHLPECRWTKA
jgi:hypothetical protein